MICPKCQSEVKRTHAGFHFDTETYWWCPSCKDEVKDPQFGTPKHRELTQQQRDEIAQLAVLGFTEDEAWKLINYATEYGIDMAKSIGSMANPYTLFTPEWREYEDRVQKAIHELYNIPTLPAGSGPIVKLAP